MNARRRVEIVVTDPHQFLSRAAQQYQESAIRKTGALAGRIKDLVSFAAGSPAPETFPWEDLSAIATELLGSRDAFALQYGATRGYRPLVEELIRLLDTRGVTASPDEVIVTTGSQQGLDLAGRVLIDPGAPVLVELPAYSGAIAAFRNLQARLVGVPQDDEGVSLAALDQVIAEESRQGARPRFLYVTPNFQNPAGSLMSRRRRAALLDAAARHDLLILEDDPYGTLYFEGSATAAETRPIKADDRDGRVVYLGSASKILVPGLRVAWMVAPPVLAERVEMAKQATDLCSGVFDQRIVHLALARGVVERLAPQLRAHYRDKRDVLEAALGDTLGDALTWRQPRGGFFLWVALPDGMDDQELFDAALAERVSFVIGSAFAVDGSGHQHARLAFSAASPDRIREGAARLARAVVRVRERGPLTR